MAVQPQVSFDGRSFADRMKRVALYKACDHFGVPYQQGAPAMVMRDSLKVAGITDQQLMSFTKVQIVNIEDENGNMRQEVYPAVEPHETARLRAEGQEINYEKIISDRAAEVAEKDAKIEEQMGNMEQMMLRLAALEANTLPLTSMAPYQLKIIAEKRGIDVTGLKKKAELLAVLEG